MMSGRVPSYVKYPGPPSDLPEPTPAAVRVRYNPGEFVTPNPAAGTPLTQTYKLDKSVKLPEFDGTGDVKGFLKRFDFQCSNLYCGAYVPDDKKRTYLFSQLKGTAALWLESLQEDWGSWDYATLI